MCGEGLKNGHKAEPPSGFQKKTSNRGMSANGQTLVLNEDLNGKPESNFSWQGSISDNSL